MITNGAKYTRGIRKRRKAPRFAAVICVLCAAILAACSAGAATAPAESPAPLAANTEADANPSATGAAIDPRYIFEDWTSRCGTGGGGEQPAVFYGVMVDGSREGNTLSVTLAREGEAYFSNTLLLATASGAWEAVFPSALEIGPAQRDVVIQCADLDADGTDEIVLTYYCGSSGGEADMHVYRVGDDGLTEIMARYDSTWVESLPWMKAAKGQPLSVYGPCAGASVFLTDDYSLALRVCHTMMAEDPSDRTRYATVLSEYAVYENGTTPLREEFMVTDADQLAAMRERLKGVLAIDAGAYIAPSGGMGADLTGSGNVMDLVFLAELGNNAGNDCIVVETQLYGGERELGALYMPPRLSGYNYALGDLDGDGADELFVLILSGGEGVEAHLLEYAGGRFQEALTVASNAPSAAETYKDTLFAPENSAGLDIPAEAFKNSVSWAGVVWLDGRYAIRLEHTADGAMNDGIPAGYSYLVFENGAWTLNKQSQTALD